LFSIAFNEIQNGGEMAEDKRQKVQKKLTAPGVEHTTYAY
jgi:hypothetical protein